MRSSDFSPLFRSTVGFDHVGRLLDSLSQHTDESSGFPPYNIEKPADNLYRVTLAVAGFREQDIEIVTADGLLTIKGRLTDEAQTPATFLHRGIATRAFERRFSLADHVRVTGASLDHGFLTVELLREVPEAKQPKRIEIRAGAPVVEPAKHAA